MGTNQGRMLMQILWMILISLVLMGAGIVALALVTRVTAKTRRP